MGRHIQKVLAIALIFVFLMSSGAALARPAEKALVKKLSTSAPYQVKETKTKWSMSDGTKLPVSVFTPVVKNTKKRFPVIVFVHGWGGDKSMTAADAAKYASTGYVTVAYTVRGWFGAEGVINTADPDLDMKDLSRVITLASKGTRFPILRDRKGPVVGVTGYSMGGLFSYLIAPRKNPRTGDPGDPRVRAVVPMHGGFDLLSSLYPNRAIKWLYVVALLGGCNFGNIFGAMMNVLTIVGNQNLTALEKLISTMSVLIRLLAKPLNNVAPELAQIYNLATQRRLSEEDWAFLYFNKRSARWWCDKEKDGVVEHPITVPTLMTTSWNDDLFCPNEALGAFNSMVTAPKKIIIGSGGHGGGYALAMPGFKSNPEIEFIEKQTADWFDHYLKGIKNGVDARPAISYYKSWDPENFGTSEVWPLAGTTDSTYYLGGKTGSREGTLSASAATASPPDVLLNTGFSGSISLPYLNDIMKMMGADQTAGIPEKVELLNLPLQRYSYVTAPLEKELFTQIERMDTFWGDDSWQNDFYQAALFNDMPGKAADNRQVVEAYVERLRKKAGFEYVTAGFPVKAQNRDLYYLIFAGPNETGKKIAEHIFNRIIFAFGRIRKRPADLFEFPVEKILIQSDITTVAISKRRSGTTTKLSEPRALCPLVQGGRSL